MVGGDFSERAFAGVSSLLKPDDFANPGHAAIAAVCYSRLEAAEVATLPVVLAALRESGEIKLVVDGENGLAGILAAGAEPATAIRLARGLAELSQLRRLRATTGELDTVIKSGDLAAVAPLLERLELTASPAATFSSWAPVSLNEYRGAPKVVPEFLARDDGHCLLYRGRVNAFNAESESGKSWLALLACLQVVRSGRAVVYVDFEDAGDAVRERLVTIGATDEEIDRVWYVRPDDPIDASARSSLARLLLGQPVDLVVLDGVTEAMVMSGWSLKENDDVALFYAALPRFLARRGPCVLLIDHVTKDKDSRGDYAIGGQHKRAGIDGASYKLEVFRQFGEGLDGAARVSVTKDRPGQVRSVAAGAKVIGEFWLRSSGALSVAELVGPKSLDQVEVDGEAVPRRTGYMERVSIALEESSVPVNRAWIERVVEGKASFVRDAIKVLVAEGHIEIERVGQQLLHTLVRPFREHVQEDMEFDEEF